jgi:hypothetical protein
VETEELLIVSKDKKDAYKVYIGHDGRLEAAKLERGVNDEWVEKGKKVLVNYSGGRIWA